MQSDIREGDIESVDSASDYVPNPDTLSGFLFERLGDRLLPATMAWLDTHPFTDPNAPASPANMDEYRLEAGEMATQFRLDAEAAVEVARDANQTSDNYVLTVIMFALVLFFSALVGTLKAKRDKLAVLALSGAALLVGVTTMLTLPIEV